VRRIAPRKDGADGLASDRALGRTGRRARSHCDLRWLALCRAVVVGNGRWSTQQEMRVNGREALLRERSWVACGWW
jgi:hypothetical protein